MNCPAYNNQIKSAKSHKMTSTTFRLFRNQPTRDCYHIVMKENFKIVHTVTNWRFNFREITIRAQNFMRHLSFLEILCRIHIQKLLLKILKIKEVIAK